MRRITLQAETPWCMRLSRHTHSCQKEGCFSLLGRVFLQNDFLYLLDFICSAKKKITVEIKVNVDGHPFAFSAHCSH